MLRVLFSLLLIPVVAFAQPIPPAGSSASGGVQLNGPTTPGRFFFPLISSIATNVAVGAANRLYATPLFVGQGSVLKSLSFDIGTGNAAAWNARMCVYADNGSGSPGALVTNGDTGTIAIGSGSVTGIQTATLNGSNGISVSGWIWVAFMADSSSESLFSINGSINSVGSLMTGLLGGTTTAGVFGSTGTSGVFMAQTFGSCPGNFGAVSYSVGAATPFLVAGF